MLSQQNENPFSPSHTSGTASVTLPGPVKPKPVTLPGPVASHTSETTLNISMEGGTATPECHRLEGAPASPAARGPEDANDSEDWFHAGDLSDAEKEASDHASAVPEAARELDPWDEYREDGELVIESQPRTAIYLNTADQVVIRQEDADGDFRQDPFVRFAQHYAPNVIRKIAELAGLDVQVAQRGQASANVPTTGRASPRRARDASPSLFGAGQ